MLISYCDSEIDKNCKALLFIIFFYWMIIWDKIPIFYVMYIRYLIFSFDKGCCMNSWAYTIFKLEVIKVSLYQISAFAILFRWSCFTYAIKPYLIFLLCLCKMHDTNKTFDNLSIIKTSHEKLSNQRQIHFFIIKQKWIQIRFPVSIAQ